MFCGFQLSNLSVPENIEDIKQKWNKRVLTYCITNLTPKLTEESIHKQIDSAFKVWDKPTALKFKKVQPNEPCDIKISFCAKEHGDGFPFEGKGGILAHGFYPGLGIGGDLHFDADEEWTDQETPPKHNLFVVAVHEIGHCLGLTHSQSIDSIMYPTYKHEWSKVSSDVLSKEDIERIQKAYGKPKVKIFDSNGFTIKVKPIENDKIKLIIEKN